jgi:acetyl-CoA acetyltransferase
MADRLRGAASIVGIGEAGIGRAGEGLTSLDLIGQAVAAAADDAGIAIDAIDGLFAATSHYAMSGLETGEYLGIRPRYSDSSNIGGASFVSHLLHAAAAIEAGLCTTAAIVYGSTQLSDSAGLVTASRPNPYEAPYGPRYPVSMYAMATARHMYEFGTTREQLAEVAVAARRWAQLTPGAFRTDELSVADVLASRVVSDPLTVADCCLVTDGAGAVILTASDRAQHARRSPVPVLGAGEAHWHRNISEMPSLTRTAAVDSGARAFAMAGVRPVDIDVVELYDAFTINVPLFLEDLGFCAKGEGGPFVASGRIAPGGALPVNTNGGGLSYCHPGMYGVFLIIEATRQLRGEALGHQVPGAELAVVHGNGAVLSGQATAILGASHTM